MTKKICVALHRQKYLKIREKKGNGEQFFNKVQLHFIILIFLRLD